MTREEVAEHNEDALFADGFDNAIIGICYRCGNNPVVAYDADKCVEILTKDMSYEEAQEYFDFNVLGSFVGENTPAFIVTD